MRSDLNPKLQNFEKKLRQRAEAAMVEIMALLEADAKANHAYTDRSGNLTASIKGEVVLVTQTAIVGTLSGNTDYAAFVENRFGDKYAYLRPALERNRDNILAIIEKHLAGNA